MLMLPSLLSRGSPGVPGWVAANSQDLGPVQAQSDGLAALSHAKPSGDGCCLSPLKLCAAICSGTGTPSLSKVSSEDYVNPLSGDKPNSWKVPLRLFRNSHAFHAFGSVFVGHPFGVKPLCVPDMPRPGYWESGKLALREGRAFAFCCVLFCELLSQIKSLASRVSWSVWMKELRAAAWHRGAGSNSHLCSGFLVK